MSDLKEVCRLSVEQCIREHLAQDVDRDNAIVEASREIVAIFSKPIEPRPMTPYDELLDARVRQLKEIGERLERGFKEAEVAEPGCGLFVLLRHIRDLRNDLAMMIRIAEEEYASF